MNYCNQTLNPEKPSDYLLFCHLSHNLISLSNHEIFNRHINQYICYLLTVDQQDGFVVSYFKMTPIQSELKTTI